jgi:hypothetical protein
MGKFDVFAGIILLFSFWMLSVASGIAVWLSWVYVETEYDEEGQLTRDSRYLVRARALLTASCIMFWICTLLGHMLTVSRGTIFGFWIDHPVPLLTLFLLADLSLIASVAFAWQSRNSGRWILWIATPMMAAASLVASYVPFGLFLDWLSTPVR